MSWKRTSDIKPKKVSQKLPKVANVKKLKFAYITNFLSANYVNKMKKKKKVT